MKGWQNHEPNETFTEYWTGANSCSRARVYDISSVETVAGTHPRKVRCKNHIYIASDPTESALPEALKVSRALSCSCDSCRAPLLRHACRDCASTSASVASICQAVWWTAGGRTPLPSSSQRGVSLLPHEYNESIAPPLFEKVPSFVRVRFSVPVDQHQVVG